MRNLPSVPRNPLLAGAVCAAALALAGSAMAQITVEELTVIGKAPATQQTVSYVVGFGDLNLRTEEGRKELRKRINLTATYVCHKLGEDQSNAFAECRSKAIEDAMVKVRQFEHDSRAHGVRLEAGHPWVPPGE